MIGALWLISSIIKHPGMNDSYDTSVTDLHPAAWLLSVSAPYDNSDWHILSAIAITQEDVSTEVWGDLLWSLESNEGELEAAPREDA